MCLTVLFAVLTTNLQQQLTAKGMKFNTVDHASFRLASPFPLLLGEVRGYSQGIGCIRHRASKRSAWHPLNFTCSPASATSSPMLLIIGDRRRKGDGAGIGT